MDIAARLRSDGRVTIPREVREALAIEEGDEVLFRVEGGGRVMMSRTPDLLELAGELDVPPSKRGTPWDEVLRETRTVRAAHRIAEDEGFWHPLTPDEFIRASGIPPYVFHTTPDDADHLDTEPFLDSIFGDGGAT